jgi:hypothetical protein
VPLTTLSEKQRAQAYARFAILWPELEEGIPQAQIARTHDLPSPVHSSLLMQVERIMQINGLQTVSKEVVVAALDNLVIGQAEKSAKKRLAIVRRHTHYLCDILTCRASPLGHFLPRIFLEERAMSDELDDTTKKEELVITPGGPRPKEFVHPVGPGEAVYVDESGNARVIPHEQEGGTVNMDADMVLTPGGFRSKSLVHLIEPGHVLDGTGGRHQKLDQSGRAVTDFGLITPRPGNEPLMPRNVAVPPREAPALGSGWIAYADWTNNTGNPITSFTTTWTVPPAPATQSGQLIYLFNGIQNSTMIYQPVLQWGASPAGGGNYWGVASWYVDSQGGPAFHSQLVRVNPGDTVIGVMTLTGQSGTSFSYNCQFQGIANSGFPIQNVQELTWCIETLEAYQITQCLDYPNIDDTAFQGINVQTGSSTPTLYWSPVNAVTDCGQHAVVMSNSNPGGEVVIYYRQPKPSTVIDSYTVGPLRLQIFAATSDCAQHPSVGVVVPDGWLILGGGAFVDWLDGVCTGLDWPSPGNLLTGMYPDRGGTVWVAASKAHFQPSPAQITGYCIAAQMQDGTPLPPSDYQIFSQTSPVAAHPSTEVFLPDGWVLVGGGARANYTEPGSLLYASFPLYLPFSPPVPPVRRDGWFAAAKDHLESGPATVTAFAIGLTRSFLAGAGLAVTHYPPSTTPIPTHHPWITLVIPDSHLVSGGAQVNWTGEGNLLTASFPQDRQTWIARGKDHFNPDPTTITAWGIGLVPA